MRTATSPIESFVCVACGTQYAPSTDPPAQCAICVDDRQYVGASGQHWTTHDELRRTHHNRIELDGELVGIGIREQFAIPQRALLVDSGAGTIMWDCVTLVTDEAVDELTRRGGLDAIAISHPHFYSSMIQWSDAFGGIPIYLHAADREWVQRRSPNIEWWDGDQLEMSPTVTLLHLPGHFPGSCGLHWSAAPSGKAVLLAGDSLHVVEDRRHVTVMHSVPNYVPVGADVIRELRARLAGIDFDDVYGFTWGRNVIGDGRAAVERSLERYLAIVSV